MKPTLPAARAASIALDVSILLVALVALYGCLVVLPSALDSTIVYKGF